MFQVATVSIPKNSLEYPASFQIFTGYYLSFNLPGKKIRIPWIWQAIVAAKQVLKTKVCFEYIEVII